MSGDVKRSYVAPRREEQARATRRGVVEAATTRFLAEGFAATTMAAVAADAGVSVPTLYKLFGTKAGLAKAVFDVAIAGDDEPIAVKDRARIQRVREATDGRRKLELYSEHLVATLPRHVPLQLVILEAAGTDAEAAAVWQQLQDERLRGMTMFAEDLRLHLRDGVTTTEARDVVWTYNSAELYRLLVIERGWSIRRYGRWVAAQLTAALLPAAAG
jgi:AcrR family transcriptional regulator